MNYNKNNTIFVLGNAPSMKPEYFDILKKIQYPTIGMNAAYRYWEKINWFPTYYCCFDYAVILSHSENISSMILDEKNPIKKFFLLERPTPKSGLDSSKRYFCETVRSHDKYVEKKHNKDFFGMSENPDSGHHPIKYSSTGSGAVRVCIELGFKNIFLLGIDAHYPTQILNESIKVTDWRLTLSKTPKLNNNYFFDDYQQAGDLYHVPGNHLNTWIELQSDIKKYNINLINCSKNSKVNFFNSSSLEDCLKFLS